MNNYALVCLKKQKTPIRIQNAYCIFIGVFLLDISEFTGNKLRNPLGFTVCNILY